jgi:hypothetical protein
VTCSGGCAQAGHMAEPDDGGERGVVLCGNVLFLFHFSFQLDDSDACSVVICAMLGAGMVACRKFVNLALQLTCYTRARTHTTAAS